MRRLARAGVLWIVCLGGFALGRACAAQGKPVRTEPEPATSFGTVTGHVYFAGSNAPARFVQLALQPTEIKSEGQPQPGKMQVPMITVYRSGLDGGFTLPRVAPGSYYLVVKEPGYLSPFSEFSLAELQHPSAEVAQRMAAVLPTVTVRPNATAVANLTLQRGASLSGVVRFDDGTPYPQAGVSVSRRGTDGKWESPRGMDAYATGDGDGRWEIGGLPPGDYRISVNLQVEDRRQSSLLADNTSMWVSNGYSLSFYLGDTARESQAKVATLTDAQALDGQDVTIPVSKLHAISGAVVDQRTGQAVNAGQVVLVYSDDGAQVATANIEPESRAFTFPFVPEGEYKLQAKNAHEARFESQGDSDSDPFHQNRKETPLRSYGPGEIPLVVRGEMNAVNVPVEARPAKPQ